MLSYVTVTNINIINIIIFEIAVIKNTINKKRKSKENQIEILNNYEKKSKIEVEVEKIGKIKINPDIILHNNDNERTNHIDKKNKKIKLHDILQDKSCMLNYFTYLKYFLKTFKLQLCACNIIITYAASKSTFQNNCEDKNKDNKNETTLEMEDKNNMCLDIVLQKDESENSNYEILEKSKLKSCDNEQNEITGIHLIFVLISYKIN